MADIAEEILTMKNVFISNQLSELIEFDNISVSNMKVIKQALELLKTKNLDFVDCLLCAYSVQDEIVTFDKKLNQCISSNQI
jgi:predicted nucleic-acid-binding protein